MREFHCPVCGYLLFRTTADARETSRIQTICPDRRCRRTTVYRLCDDDRPGNRRLFLERWHADRERGLREPRNGVALRATA